MSILQTCKLHTCWDPVAVRRPLASHVPRWLQPQAPHRQAPAAAGPCVELSVTDDIELWRLQLHCGGGAGPCNKYMDIRI